MSRSGAFIADFVIVTSNGATDVAVSHVVESTPRGYIVCRKAAAGSLYPGATAWTSTTAYFKSDVTGIDFLVLLFI